ncbi:MAG: hypothetical protein QM811_18830 [Pirellulales bacterium]
MRPTVVEILSVTGVDVVADPATTRGLFEAHHQELEQEIAEDETTNASAESTTTTDASMSESTMRDETRMLVDSLRADTVRLTALHDDARSECAELRETCARLRDEHAALTAARDAALCAAARAERAARAKTWLRELGLPDPDGAATAARAIVDGPFWESLLSATDDAELRTRIVDRAALLEAVRRWDALRGHENADDCDPPRGPLSCEQGTETPPPELRADTTRRFAEALKRA